MPNASPQPSDTNPAPFLPADWLEKLPAETVERLAPVLGFVAEERRRHTVFPPEADVFRAFELTPFDRTRVVILGQDPYHDDGQAHGLCFSVRAGVKPPPSLRNLFKELASDLGTEPPSSGLLEGWAEQGVLLLNTVLTVRAHAANSHRNEGWEEFTDDVIRALSSHPSHIVFLLWGAPAQKKKALIDSTRHTLLQAPHPSPLSAHRGFFGSRPFSKTNDALERHGQPRIDWTKTSRV